MSGIFTWILVAGLGAAVLICGLAHLADRDVDHFHNLGEPIHPDDIGTRQDEL
ncbi:hypothetical protein [Afipia felis]|uniref:Uncharacterized protein n=2 Tax=Afipia felis TaxID=1035 RepID=A0A381AZJ1_AFIFE|nr:hypothetical protein [Afipia felis]EKS26713.1 hypothetical protein HMPREF9697_04016 [Afipia felis ATCC 53690]SUU76138.1 Uncharacterised protein [Afipia felis]SUU84205.1 Uncharacterised protein [Afipia felis]SUW28240.1 Uncharacterised protein [Afipia felis]